MSIKTFKVVLRTMNKGQPEEFAYVFEGKSLLIGRASQHSKADFKLYNDFVSREHCQIYMKEGKLLIEDLSSKHGTSVNQMPLVPGQPCLIEPGDTITLINGMIEFMISIDNDLTQDFTPLNITFHQNVVIKEHLQTVIINEKDPIKMPLKEFTCFNLLYENLENLISKEEIVRHVWPERIGDPQQIVSAEEIASLLYRVRKRVNGHFAIKAVVQKGYYMESTLSINLSDL
ncbi:FHA domain-containing protein [Peribacillus butanolivorans]|uniref:FHA domain-containing protein n=1 Tax=Peribacillus butanolivorans TaxID=421767 RepID=UPI002E2413D3|nr:FHA domain-containing protein [Peribacillus butanolivorans]MED3690919.1 FHA domain-containing protein [Peribacillus butanolivorans]